MFFELPHRIGVSRRADLVRAANRNQIGIVARRFFFFVHGLHHLFAFFVVRPNDLCAEQVVEQNVSGEFGWRVAAQNDDATEAELGGSRRRLTAVVGLCCAAGDDRFRFLRARVGQQKFQLASLVAATGEPGLIITLDPNFCAAEMGCESLQRLDGCGQMGERDSRGKIHVGEWLMANSVMSDT